MGGALLSQQASKDGNPECSGFSQSSLGRITVGNRRGCQEHWEDISITNNKVHALGPRKLSP